jgi:alpha-beta hydrolase superfamily lysophospholipase
MRKYLQVTPAAQNDSVPTAADLASFLALDSWMKRSQGISMPEAELRQHYGSKPNGGVGKERDISKAADAIAAGQQKYTDIRVPVLAMCSRPRDKVNSAREELQAKAFERGISSARVVWVPHANHYVFLSNEAGVLREMDAFLATLP